MKVWVDAQLSPALARWFRESLNLEATALKDLGLRDSEDSVVLFAAREARGIVLTKDRDFVDLVRVHGAPPRIVWITCGNTSTANLQSVLAESRPAARDLLNANERLVEIGGRTP